MKENLTPTLIAETIKESPKILNNLYNDLIQPGVIKIGKALESVLDIANTILYPINLINGKAKVLLIKNLDKYKERLETIPDENIVDVHAEIGIPILQRLTYVSNEELSTLFANLLAAASNIDYVNCAHPVFIQFIDRITGDEAKILKKIKNGDGIIYIDIEMTKIEENTRHIIGWNLTGLEKSLDLICPSNIDLYLDNLISMNIIFTRPNYKRLGSPIYAELEETYQYVIDDQIKSYKKECEFAIVERLFEITDMGKLFLNIAL